MDRSDPKRPNPAERCSLLSLLFFLYMFPIFKKTYSEDLTVDDLFEPLKEHKSQDLGSLLEKIWDEELEKHKKYALHKALLRLFGARFMLFGMIKLLDQIMLIIVIPMCIGKLVSHFSQTQASSSSSSPSSSSSSSNTEVYYYTSGLILCLFTDSLMSHPTYMGLQHTAMKIRIACSSLVYRKLLKLNRAALLDTTVGQLVNLLSNDVSRFDEAFSIAHFSWIGPVQVAIGVYLLYREIGMGSICGAGFLMMFVPFQIWLAEKSSVLRLRTALSTDERVRLTDDILNGIAIIKMYCWEKPFENLVKEARRIESRWILLHSYIVGIIYSFEIFICRTSIFVSITVYVLLGNSLDAEKVFTVSAIYSCLRPVITMLFSLSISAVAEIDVSIKRIHGFLIKNHIEDSAMVSVEEKIKSGGEFGPRIRFENVYAKWKGDSRENTLKNVSFDVTSNDLVVLIGPIGSGKTSILNAVLKELPIISGKLKVVGKISFASQEPWVFSSDVRENVVFAENYDEKRYRSVLEACALVQDISTLPHGDRTSVGEKGRALSGGQRSRINLARSLYKKADIYLLDDPLSAVDTQVARHVYLNSIKNFLLDKTCLLVTHNLEFVRAVDKIVVVRDGGVEMEGSLEEVRTRFGGEWVAEAVRSAEDVEDAGNGSGGGGVSDAGDYDGVEDFLERSQSGGIDFGVYWRYLRAGGDGRSMVTLVLLFVVCQALANGGEYFLSYWVNLEQDYNRNESIPTTIVRSHIMIIYLSITAGTIVIGVIKSMYFMAFFTDASKNLHDSMFSSVLRTSMSFFDSNPSGRILNRFSKDLGIADEYIPAVLIDVIEIGLQLIGVVVLCTIAEPYLAIVSGILMTVFYLIRIVYVRTSRNVKRIEATTKSPILTHVTSTMSGLDSIRAFRAEETLIGQFDHLQDVHSSAWYLYIAAGKCFSLWLDLVCQFFIVLVLCTLFFVNRVAYAGDLGLVITQYLSLMGSLQWGVRQWTELETNMTSVERILEYADLKIEGGAPGNVEEVPPDWPRKGNIDFKEVSMRYDFTESYVLRGVNFTVESGERIGIVGRTGAGKSSIISALFRLYEIEGTIAIDDVETTKIGLEELRSKISIIPQEPVLFSATLRQNLDPFHDSDDSTLWHALECVGLKETFIQTSSGLDTVISEGGRNFSVGERQLVCLARALLRSNNILVLDEATANVDNRTDLLMQQAIRNRFSNCTILIVAHRLSTVMDCDKILTLNRGVVEEYDHPYVLLQSERGVLRRLVEASGPEASQRLKAMAKKGFDKIKMEKMSDVDV